MSSHRLAGLVLCAAFTITACGGGVAFTDGGDASSVGDASTSTSVTTDGGVSKKSDSGLKDAGRLASCGEAVEGAKCAKEGESCGSPCPDACQFCTRLYCTGGVWGAMEAFPLPANECGDTFACGGATCKKGEMCVVNHPGVALADGGVPPPVYACLPLEATCSRGCSCAMTAAKSMSSCTPTSCASPAGGPVVQCHGV